jgi:hypothetical protein
LNLTGSGSDIESLNNASDSRGKSELVIVVSNKFECIGRSIKVEKHLIAGTVGES